MALALVVSCNEASYIPSAHPDMTMEIKDPCDSEIEAFHKERELLFGYGSIGVVSCIETNPKVVSKSTNDFSCGQFVYHIEETVPESMRLTYIGSQFKPNSTLIRVDGDNKTITKCVKDKYKGIIACVQPFIDFYCPLS